MESERVNFQWIFNGQHDSNNGISGQKRTRLKGLFIVLSLVTLSVIYFLIQREINGQDLSNYAIVIDAGSSGSRAYIYHWPEPSGSNQLLQISPMTDENGEPLVEGVTPGLSSLKDNPEGAKEYIAPLLDFCAKNIPKESHSDTQLFILATAGMRLLPKTDQDAIISNVRSGISKNYRFQFPDGNMEIISGIQEGIYQWLAINYVLDRFKPGNGGTVGALDMGGASMQIAVEIPKTLKTENLGDEEKSQLVEVNIGNDKGLSFTLFVTTFLGYGANEARSRHFRNLLLSEPGKGLKESDPKEDPCLPKNLLTKVDVKIDHEKLEDQEKLKHLQDQGFEGQIYISGTGQWDQCYEMLKGFVSVSEKHYKKCTKDRDSCPSNGIKIPPVNSNGMKFYGFSEFWYSMEDLLHQGGDYDAKKFKESASELCAKEWSDVQSDVKAGLYSDSDNERFETECFKSAWVAVSLHEGFKISKDSPNMQSVPNTVDGKVVHWTIGALLYRTRLQTSSFKESISSGIEGLRPSCPSLTYLYPYPQTSKPFEAVFPSREILASLFATFKKTV